MDTEKHKKADEIRRKKDEISRELGKLEDNQDNISCVGYFRNGRDCTVTIPKIYRKPITLIMISAYKERLAEIEKEYEEL